MRPLQNGIDPEKVGPFPSRLILDRRERPPILIQPAGVGVTTGVGVAIGLSVGVGVATGLSVGVGEGRGSTSLHASRQASKACLHAA